MLKISSILTAVLLSFTLIATASPATAAIAKPVATAKAPACHPTVAKFLKTEKARCNARELWIKLNDDAVKVLKEANSSKRTEIVAKNYLVVSAPLAKADAKRWSNSLETNLKLVKEKSLKSASNTNKIMIALRDTVSENQTLVGQIEAASITLGIAAILSKVSLPAAIVFSAMSPNSFLNSLKMPSVQSPQAKRAAEKHFAKLKTLFSKM